MSIELPDEELFINQGSDFEKHWPIQDQNGNGADLTGWGVRAQVRAPLEADEPLYEWNAVAGNASISGSTVILKVPAAVSSAWDTARWNLARFDIELFRDSPAGVIRIVQGLVRVSPEVTRG